MQHSDRWDLPKGHVDPGETDEEAALRELDEETGIQAADIELLDGFVYESRYSVNGRRYGMGNGDVEKTMRIFAARLINEVELKLTEHEGYQWFPWSPPHAIQKRAIDPLLKELEHFLK